MAARRAWCPDRRDLSWINCNLQARREMKDVQPLVHSRRGFNERTGIVIGLPMTTATDNETNRLAVKGWQWLTSTIPAIKSNCRRPGELHPPTSRRCRGPEKAVSAETGRVPRYVNGLITPTPVGS
jgi:hypothetical protein